MKRTLSLLAVTAAVSLMAAPALAESAQTNTGAAANANAAASADAQQETGFFDKIGNFFSGNDFQQR